MSISRDISSYPAAKGKSKLWVAEWNRFLPDVIKRENFKLGHLRQLEILCDVLEEYEENGKIIREEGRYYETEGRFGLQKKMHPAVERNVKLLSEVRHYSKLLGISLHKDTESTNTKVNDEWDDDE